MPELHSSSCPGQVGPDKPKVVPDTNVLVSGMMGVKSPPREIIDAWLEERFTLMTSLYLIEELAHVLAYPRIAERIRLDAADVHAVLAALLSQAEVTSGALELPGVTRDPKDDAAVACAVVGQAGFIVSGDQDLLMLGMYEGIAVVTPRRFLEVLADQAGMPEEGG